MNQKNRNGISGPVNSPPGLEMEVDGISVKFVSGETIYEVALRQKKEIPTLCYDPRLEAFGACRLCVVKVEGIRNPVASCTTRAEVGMKVQTQTEEIEKYRKVLLEMVASENRQVKVDPLRGSASQELDLLVRRYGADTDRFIGKRSGVSRTDDENPFILRDYNQCISCFRCVRVCAEQEADYAISVMGRGFNTQITTEFNGELKESSCTFCGQCIQTCPTGALADLKAMSGAELPGPVKKTRTICPYCGVGCSIDILTKEDSMVGVQPAMDGPANKGALCVKGQFAYDFVQHPDRLDRPLVRGSDGELRDADWDEAIEVAAAGFRCAAKEYGRHSIYGIASGRAPTEAAYTMQKFIRAGFGTNQIDNCSRA